LKEYIRMGIAAIGLEHLSMSPYCLMAITDGSLMGYHGQLIDRIAQLERPLML